MFIFRFNVYISFSQKVLRLLPVDYHLGPLPRLYEPENIIEMMLRFYDVMFHIVGWVGGTINSLRFSNIKS